ncbi:phospholipase A2-like [Uloborus diversus]|uniref:phospholipase A2-like n=1 Tax=Uloborus diversus TaxID=327109 RepID=UPI00240929FB|nr:phospholipase A2-like [Uloborus diversus]
MVVKDIILVAPTISSGISICVSSITSEDTNQQDYDMEQKELSNLRHSDTQSAYYAIVTNVPIYYITLISQYKHSNKTEVPIKRTRRTKRHVMQMARMLKCTSGCNPLSYRGYGCYCGYKGSGQPVDDIDQCCLQHDYCYSFINCPSVLIYFVPYTWQCMIPGAAHCRVASTSGLSQQCATQLCECDREFARCISNYPCPQEKPGCEESNFILLQAMNDDRL